MNQRLEILESVYEEVTKSQTDSTTGAPRILLLGPIIARGDYNIVEMIQEAGGELVIEDICEGLRYYWRDIEKNGDPIESLARGYLRDRVPCAFMRNSARPRLDFALDLVRDFSVSGVIWYELLCCEAYDAESYFFSQELGARNIPVLILESDYGVADVERLKNRVDAFVELIRGGIE